MEGEYRDGKRWCYFHPSQLVIGVCALCLHQRLLLLQQKHHHHHRHHISSSSISLRKVFPFASLLNRLPIVRAHRRKPDHDDTTASISQQDSFISINLEDNTIAASSPWEKNAKLPSSHQNDCGPRIALNHNIIKELKSKDEVESPRRLKSLVGHAKPRSDPRWRKRIGQWFQLIRRKRSSK